MAIQSHPPLTANVTRARPAPRVSKGSARMFDSSFLEFFSHVHPATPALLFLPVIAIGLYLTATRTPLAWPAASAMVVGGYLMWTGFEYWFHRLFFHLPVIGPKTKTLYFFVHGVHHDYPWDTSRLVMPPTISVTLGVAFWFLFHALLGPNMYPLFTGFVAGYLIYDSTHWYVHARTPKTRFGKWVRREHMIHHFKEPTSRYGVSCPWLDTVFATTGSKIADTDTEG